MIYPSKDAEYVVALNCHDITNMDLSKLQEIKENTTRITHPRFN